LINRPRLELSGSGAGFHCGGAIIYEARGFPFKAKLMTQDFIFAQDVILDPDTGEILAVVRNGGVWRNGARIAVLVGAHMYDLNGNLLGKLAAGAGSLPISFKNLVEGKSGAHAALAGDAANRLPFSQPLGACA
jgi:hypothetical protein